MSRDLKYDLTEIALRAIIKSALLAMLYLDAIGMPLMWSVGA